MGGDHASSSCADRAGDEVGDRQRFEGGGDADDVDDGVDGTDLVELDIVGIDAVDRCLGDGQGVEDGLGPSPDALAEIGRVEQLADLARRAVLVGVMLVDDDVGPRRRHAATLHSLERQGVTVQGHAPESGEHRLLLSAGIDQRPEQHVAGDPGAALHVGDSTGYGHDRRILATAHAAPKPLSMPTTVTPLAHDACIASSAVTPPSEAP